MIEHLFYFIFGYLGGGVIASLYWLSKDVILYRMSNGKRDARGIGGNCWFCIHSMVNSYGNVS